MTYFAEQIFQPRSFIHASNEHALVLESETPQTKLTFLNSERTTEVTPNFSISSFYQDFQIAKSERIITKYEIDFQGNPRQTTFGALYASNLHLLEENAVKGLVFQDYNESSTNEFAGISYYGGIMVHQIPTITSRFVFQAALGSGLNMELMRIQEGDGVAQVGIGTNYFAPNVALAVEGNTQISGSLTVTGDLNFSESSLAEFVRYDETTQRVPVNALPTSVPILTQNNQLDESVIPHTGNFQYLRTSKNVGIGTKSAVQKLHVHGSGVFHERIGVGTLYPSSRCHIYEGSASIPALRIQNMAGGSILETFIGNTRAVTIPGTHPSLGVNTQTIPLNTTFAVVGNSVLNGDIRCSNVILQGKLTATNLEITNIMDTRLRNEGGIMTPIVHVDQSIYMNPFKTLFVNKLVDVGQQYINVGDTSLLVGKKMHVGTQVATVADNNSIVNKITLNGVEALQTVKKLQAYKYQYSTTDQTESVVGLTGNDILTLPVFTSDERSRLCATNYENKISVRYDTVVSYLVECVKRLDERIAVLENRA